MRLVLKILGLIGAVILSVVIVAGLQSPEYKIERSRTIQASPEALFAYVGDLRKWREWSAWAEMDPAIEVSFEGPETGVGSIENWKVSKIGQGSNRVMEYEPPTRIKYQIAHKDKNAINYGEIILTPAGTSTDVTWTLQGQNNLIGRIFSLVLGANKTAIKNLDRGLELLDSRVTTNKP